MLMRLYEALLRRMSPSGPPVPAPLMPRASNLSGNVFHFRLPENFSRDMPAKPLVESVDLNNPRAFRDPGVGELIMRW